MENATTRFDSTAAAPLKVFIAEDSPVMRPRMVAMVRREEGLVVCGTAETTGEVLAGIIATCADAVILDINLRDGNSLPALKQAIASQPGLFAIVCSNSVGEVYREAARDAGARHFIDKSLECERIPALLNAFRIQAGAFRQFH